MRKKIVAGNWKMNTLPAEGVELAKAIAAGRDQVCECVHFIVCPPFTHLLPVHDALRGSGIVLGAQDCAAEAKGRSEERRVGKECRSRWSPYH